jgi:AAA15 family ATPase/GTPase
MSGLILDSLKVRNFRGFRHLQIERLGRVNLIVGKNNVGKTSLLEALQLYAKRAD